MSEQEPATRRRYMGQTHAECDCPTPIHEDLVERIRDVIECKGALSDSTALAAADEIEYLRGVLVHYGQLAGADMAEIRRLCRL